MNQADAIQTLLSQSAEMRDALVELEATLRERCPAHTKRLDRMELMLDGPPGNGKRPGLLARVGVVEGTIRRFDRARALVCAGAGAAVGGLIVALLERLF